MATPAAEIDIDAPLVEALLASQCPELAHLPVRVVANGWDNTIARVGDDWLVRLPRRAASAPLVENEQRWLPVLAPSLPLTVPVPWFAGRPSDVFPWPNDPVEAARTLATFVAALHVPAPADAPLNEFRGVALQQRAAAVEQRVAAMGAGVDAARVLAVWAELSATPPWPGPPLWLHGDLHGSNLLTTTVGQSRRLSAVIDFGDITAGDPATDLAVDFIDELLEHVQQLEQP